MARKSIQERFWAKVAKTDTCWLWTASRISSSGYGQFHIDGGTSAENTADKITKGRQPRGERVALSKLTADQVRSILGDTRPQWIVAKEYGVCREMIGCIRRRTSWKHITTPPVPSEARSG